MPVPSPRNSIRIARGNFADLEINASTIGEGELCFAVDRDRFYSKSGGQLVAVGGGTELYSINQLGDVDISGATEGQVLAYDATQSKWLPVNDQVSDLSNYIQQGDNVSVLTNDAGYITAADVPSFPSLDPYVEKAGDNMTGDLTLGTDKITLDAATGAGSFANTIVSGDTTYASSYAFISKDAIGLQDNSSTSKFSVDATNGKAEFGTIAADFTNGIVVNGNTGLGQSYIAIYGSGSGENALQIYQNDGIAPKDTVLIKHNGSAQFASQRFNIDKDGGAAIVYQGADDATPCLDLYVPNGAVTTPFIRGTNGLTEVVSINPDGSASFAGDIQIGGNPDSGTANGIKALNNGFLILSRNGDNAIFAGHSTGNNSATSVITAGGSATFAETVTINDIDVSSNLTSGCEVRSDGLVRAQRPTGSSGSAVFQGWNGNLNSSSITAGGSATFAGEVVAGGLSGSGGVGPNGYVFTGYVGANQTGSLTSSIDRNGAAKFANDLTLTGGADGAGATSSNLNFALTNVASTGYIRTEASGSGGPGGFGSNMCFYTKGDASAGYTKALTLGLDGSGTFAGSILSGTVAPTTDRSGIEVGANGVLSIQRTAAASSSSAIDVYSGTTANPVASIGANGSASFAGEVLAGTGSSSLFTRNYSGSSPNLVGAFRAQHEGVDKAVIFTDGAASFSGQVVATVNNASGDDSALKAVQTNADGYALWIGSGPTAVNRTAFILPNGAASFAGSVDVGDFTTYTSGTRITSSGTIYVGGVGANPALTVGTGGSQTASINYDGSAVFESYLYSKYAGKGQVQLAASSSYGLMIKDDSDNINISLNWDGSFQFGGSTNYLKHTSADGLFRVTSGSTKWNLAADGSASFAENVTVGPKTISSQTRYTTLGTSFDVGAASGFCFAHYGSGNNVLAGIKENGYAEFVGTVTANTLTAGGSTTFCQLFGNGSAQGYEGGVQRWYLNNTGAAVFTGTVSAQGSVLTSDRKFKTNIEPAKSQLSDVVQLGNLLKNWNWKEDAPVADKDSRFLGLIAQEAEEVSPGIVANLGEGEDAYKGIKNDVLVMKLLGAVAELKADNDKLRSRLEALEEG